MEVAFCLEALEASLQVARPAIFNSDQGSQFTSRKYTGRLENEGIQITMSGRGRVFDNIFIERLWRTVKCEEVYLGDSIHVRDALEDWSRYFDFHNRGRLQQALGYRTPH